MPATLDDCLKLNDAGKEPETLCEAVWLRLSQVILAEAGKLEAVEPLQREQDAHHEFGRERARLFVGREDVLARIAEYLAGSDNHPLAVWGESGSGKSALMARAVQQAAEQHATGSDRSPASSAPRPNHPTAAPYWKACAGRSRAPTEAMKAPSRSNTATWCRSFPSAWRWRRPEKPLVLFLDALDQLSDGDNARSLIWLPAELPPHVRLVVSTLPGECQAALQRRLPASSLVPVPALSKSSGESCCSAGWMRPGAP